MALGTNSSAVLSSVFVSQGLSQPALFTSGSSSFFPFCVGDTEALFNSGTTIVGDPLLLREVAPGTSGLFGKCVQVTGFGPSFRGPVIAALRIEGGTTGGTGPLTECVLVQSADGFRFIALVAVVTEVDC